MSPLPDRAWGLGPFLVRRWGRWVRFSFRKSHERGNFSFGFNLPWDPS